MKKFFIVYGIVICLIFSYASYWGIDLMDSVKTGKWSPQGHSLYHK